MAARWPNRVGYVRMISLPAPALLFPLFPAQFVATHEVGLGGEQPVLLHGGGLLGVVLNKPAPSGAGKQGPRALPTRALVFGVLEKRWPAEHHAAAPPWKG